MLMLVACGGEDTASAESADVNEQNVNQSENLNPADTSNNADIDMVASVNGVAITQEDFDRSYGRISVNSNASDDTALRIQVLNTLIEQEVISQSAAELGITVAEADIDAEIAGLREGLGDTSWDAWLASNQYTEDELRAALENSIVTNRVRDQVIAQLGEAVEQVHARHILVATEAEAQSVLDRLAAGEDFSALAAELSLDVTTREFGGDLGWFIREELLDVALADTAFSIGAGEISNPVVTRLGYHILQTIEKGQREIEPARMPLLVENLFSRWLEEQLLAADVVRT